MHRFGPPALFLLTILSTGWLSGPTAFVVLFLACCIGAWQVHYRPSSLPSSAEQQLSKLVSTQQAESPWQACSNAN